MERPVVSCHAVPALRDPVRSFAAKLRDRTLHFERRGDFAHDRMVLFERF